MIKKTALVIIFAACAITSLVYADRVEPLKFTGKDGTFHFDKRMYMCMNISFDPGPDPRSSAFLKGELLFNGVDGHDGIGKNDACVHVTQEMIDRQNKVLDAVALHGGMKPWESVTLPIKKGSK